MTNLQSSFQIKCNANSLIEWYKGHFIAKGFLQYSSFEYNYTFVPIPKWASIWAILALVVLENLELKSVDIFFAYLNSDLKEEVYMCQPKSFEEKTSQ